MSHNFPNTEVGSSAGEWRPSNPWLPITTAVLEADQTFTGSNTFSKPIKLSDANVNLGNVSDQFTFNVATGDGYEFRVGAATELEVGKDSLVFVQTEDPVVQISFDWSVADELLLKIAGGGIYVFEPTVFRPITNNSVDLGTDALKFKAGFFAGTVKANILQSTVATGTAPFTIASITLCTNLNVDLLDGFHSSAFGRLGANNTWDLLQTFDGGISVLGSAGIALGTGTGFTVGGGDLEYSVPTAKTHNFLIDSALEVTIAANTITLENGATDWVIDFASVATLKFNWGVLTPLHISVGGPIPGADDVYALGSGVAGWTDVFLADNGACKFRNLATHRIGSDTVNEIEVVAPNIVNLVVGSTDIVSVDSTGMYIVDNSGLVIGHTAKIDFGATPELQVLGVDGSDASMGFARFSANAGGATLRFLKSRSGTIGINTIVQDGDELGRIRFQAADGTDFNTNAAEISAEVDGTPGANDVPGRLLFSTTPDGASAVTEKMRLTQDGKLGIGTTNPNQLLTIEGTFSLKEQASANADTAAYGQIWVKTATPNQLWFTNDAGTDTQLGLSGGATFTVSTTEVFSGTSPTSMTDLDLSGTVGANKALVALSFKSAADMNALAVRTDGDASTYYSASADASAYGCHLGHHDSVADLVLIVATNSSGVIEWQTETAQTCTVDILWYIA